MQRTLRRPPLARAGRHPIALVGWLLPSATLAGTGCALIINVAPLAQTPLPAFILTVFLLLALGRTLIYPFGVWFRFALVIYSDWASVSCPTRLPARL